MSTRNMADLRQALDDLDRVILSALGERARLSRDIVAAKSEAASPLRDEVREAALLDHRSAYGERLGLDPVFVRRLYREILDDSVRRQQDFVVCNRWKMVMSNLAISSSESTTKRSRIQTTCSVYSTNIK